VSAPTPGEAAGDSPRVLFRSHNRRGLGHLMRALNVAREIRAISPGAGIVLHTRNPSTAQFCPPDVEWVLDDGNDPANGWHATLRAVDPDVVVYDTMIPDDPYTEPIPAAARVAYVMRRCADERHQAIVESAFLERVDVAVVPHDRDEFDRPVPDSIADRLVFVGPIVRAPDPVRAACLRARHGLDGATRVIVSSAGGGGFAETAEPFFDGVWDAHRRLGGDPGLRHVVVLGPHNGGAREALPGMRLVKSEPDLVDLFALADLVISEGGYNSVNEIRLVGAPACFVPGRRRWDDQLQRVRALEARGLAAVVEPGPAADTGARIAAIADDHALLASLRRRNRELPVLPGNHGAARAILGARAA